MPLMKYRGGLLRRNGAFATDPRCCCTGSGSGSGSRSGSVSGSVSSSVSGSISGGVLGSVSGSVSGSRSGSVSGSRSGSGLSGSGSGITQIITICCPGGVPSLLYGHITAKTGWAVNLPDTVPLVYNGLAASPGAWGWDTSYASIMCGFSNPAARPDLTLACDSGGVWRLRSGAGILGVVNQAPDLSPTPQCNPFNMTWSVTLGAAPSTCGAGSYKIQIMST